MGVAGLVVLLVVALRAMRSAPDADGTGARSSADSAPRSMPESVPGDRRARERSNQVLMPAPGANGGVSPRTPLPSSGGRETASDAAVERSLAVAADQFVFTALPMIDGCLGPILGPRRARAVSVEFQRVGSPPGPTRLVARSVQLTEASAAPAPQNREPALDRCLSRLVGRELLAPIPAGAVPLQLHSVVTIPLPEPPQVEQESEKR